MFRKRLTFVPLLGVALVPLFLGRPAVSEPAQKLLAVLEFKGANLKADILDTMSDAVRGGASDALTGTGTNVMTRESMLVLLKEMGIKECTEGDCEVETARNIGADYVISGRIVQMDGSYVATLKLHETKRGTLLGTQDAEAKKQKDLWHALKEQGRKLVAEKLVVRPNPPAVASPVPSSPTVAPLAPAASSAIPLQPSQSKLMSLTAHDLVIAMESVQPKVQACANQYKVPGTAMTNISVAAGGKVLRVTVSGKFAGTPTGTCVETAAMSAEFPACQAMTFPWPFTVSPR